MALSGCGGGDHSAPETPSVKPPVQVGPSSTITDACRRAARQTKLGAVYCPPVAPQGRTETYPKRQHFVGFGPQTYFISFRSRSLAKSKRAFAHDPAAGHWVMAAAQPAHFLVTTVDARARSPNITSGEKRRFITVDGVRAAILTGNTSTAGFASPGHAIVYWTIQNTGYMVSVRFSRNVSVAEQMARGLVAQIHDCQGSAAAQDRPQSCQWVFPRG
jgi:hypothetical protein